MFTFSCVYVSAFPRVHIRQCLVACTCTMPMYLGLLATVTYSCLCTVYVFTLACVYVFTLACVYVYVRWCLLSMVLLVTWILSFHIKNACFQGKSRCLASGYLREYIHIGQSLTCTLCIATDEGLRGRNVLHSLRVHS